MAIQTWKTDLLTDLDQSSLRELRTWLKLHARPVPSRDADVIAKYLRTVINNNSAWDGVPVVFKIYRPERPGQPWQNGFEHEARRGVRGLPAGQHRLIELAVGSFGLLVMLACYIAFAN